METVWKPNWHTDCEFPADKNSSVTVKWYLTIRPRNICLWTAMYGTKMLHSQPPFRWSICRHVIVSRVFLLIMEIGGVNERGMEYGAAGFGVDGNWTRLGQVRKIIGAINLRIHYHCAASPMTTSGWFPFQCEFSERDYDVSRGDEKI